jgi:hypothetical protein
MSNEIRELTVDELEAASGGRNLTPLQVVELGMIAGFMQAGGTVTCTRNECYFER